MFYSSKTVVRRSGDDTPPCPSGAHTHKASEEGRFTASEGPFIAFEGPFTASGPFKGEHGPIRAQYAQRNARPLARHHLQVPNCLQITTTQNTT
jgi:hypothetical protein